VASTNTRGQIVTDALSLAGRGQELVGPARGWLNYWLLHVGLTFRFPELRKVGTATSLAMGANTSPLPADFGAGMEKQGMIFGTDNKPLDELSYEDFAYNNGFPPSGGVSTGRPYRYMVDKNADVFRFELFADQAYPFTPVYFMTPPLVPPVSADDGQFIWMDNDILAIEGLKLMIYSFKEDDREAAQEAKVERMLNQWKRETTKLGGTSRVMPSPSRFKHMNFGGYGYGP
jgi:hypothetical protein